MRTAPAFQLCPQRSSGWSIIVATLFALAAAVALAWALDAEGARRGLAVLAVLWTLGCAAWHGGSGRAPAVGSLRWDGQCWQWGPAHSRGHEPSTGRVRVALDGSSFILLQLTPAGGRFKPSIWLPLARRDHPEAWHALRCALYAPAITGASA